MEAPDRVEAILEDARGLEVSAIERLQAGDIRDAAEKAWIATKRAADALILAGASYVGPDGTGNASPPAG